ncbi:heterokaryon incompatibility protein-domain-containing protein [Ilyonectria sp. MPI-CAGE-AT-0026]|nr:heterokaryon incompatibility protein-domain-containing protein [Ilyonectria sp. MPI-CAGE-AT-0026]
MAQEPLGPCSLCCGLIAHITNTIDRSAEESVETTARQPPWHETPQQILESGTSCLLCESIWQATLLPLLENTERELDNITKVLLRFGSYNKVNSVYWANIHTTLEFKEYKEFITHVDCIGISIQPDGSLSQHPDWLKCRETSRSVDRMAEERLKLMKAWLRDCQDHHSTCHTPITLERLPRRLLHVGKKDSLRLVLSVNQPISTMRYATLSHCWGGTSPVHTSRSTLAAFEASIPEDSLPKTFLDAIKIARYLDIPYLWIDSLCIVQDDIEDWQQEAAKMQHVYSGSSLTIAATDAENSTGGCLPTTADLSCAPIDPLTWPHGEVSLLHPTTQPTTSRRSPNGSHVISFDVPELRSHMMVHVQAGTPWSVQRAKHLSSRGWVFQEQLLSNRIVHCMQEEIHWQCRQIYKTQAGQSIDDEKLREGRDNFYHLPSKRRERMWCDWMEEYSTRDFSFDNDRLPALTGIVDHYTKTTGHSHLLGLWRETFARDLLWLRSGDIKGSSCPRSPSWTWLSCNAPIMIDQFTISMVDAEPKEDHVVLLEDEVIWTGLPMTSTIQSSRLVIRGPLQTLRFRIDPRSKEHFDPPYFQFEGEDLDTSDPLPWTCIGQFDSEDPSPGEYADYTCLLVRTRKHGDQGKFKEVFLILEPAMEIGCHEDESQPLAFRRIGLGCKRGATQRTFTSTTEMTIRLY